MDRPTPLPDGFLRELKELEDAYLRHSNPIEQSGFHGGADRWRAEREPILDAIESDGDLLDVGCANGYLLECLVEWGWKRDVALTPYGLDQGARLIELAQQRQPHLADHFFIGNAWDWVPPRRFRYVYSLLDQVPPGYLKPYLLRLLSTTVEPGGRLIVGDYGSRSRGVPARNIAAALEGAGLMVVGETSGGEGEDGAVARFAWVERGG